MIGGYIPVIYNTIRLINGHGRSDTKQEIAKGSNITKRIKHRKKGTASYNSIIHVAQPNG